MAAWIILAFVTAFVLLLFSRIYRFGSLKGAFFGAAVRRSVGEVEIARTSLVSLVVRVHALDGAPEKAVGLEIAATGIASWQMTPVVLSSAEARELLRALQTAIDETSAPDRPRLPDVPTT